MPEVSENIQLAKKNGVTALIDMARRRGLHASMHEAELAWDCVTVKSEAERLSAAWKYLFQGYSTTESQIRMLSNAQLPVWVVVDGCVGVLQKISDSDTDRSSDIEWLGEKPSGVDGRT